MGTQEQATATFERNIEAQTGRSIAAWVHAVQGIGEARHGQIVAWLKAEHALSHAHANHIAKQVTAAAMPHTGDDPLAPLFQGKEGLRPLYDKLSAGIAAFGPDVTFAPKKANVSVRRRRQFALLQPSTRTRLDVGLILARSAGGRLEASGSFNAMFSHRVKLSQPGDIDREVLAWIKEAYDEAA